MVDGGDTQAALEDDKGRTSVAPAEGGAVEGASVDDGGTADAGTEGREQGPHVRYGVTEPISLGLPTQAELALTEQLQEEMRRDAPLESQEGMKNRASVLVELHRIVLQWIYEVGISQGLDEETAQQAGAKIFTFGSFRLGLVQPGSDIDALCVCPRHISRESFFQVLVPKLQEHPDVTDLSPVPDAYVPIIKMKISGVEIDLLFARLASMAQIPDELESLMDDNLLKNLDDKTVRSLNGCRVADHILSMVPDAERFRDALRLIKVWAKRRGIYSNVLGFYGGITWAILVARVCQLYPYYSAAALVKRFFRIYDRWNWKNPVMLCPIREQSSVAGLMAFKVWNPKMHPQDRMHLMPIITPAFPSMNSTHNVTETTKRILQEEFNRGYRATEEVEKMKCGWSEVYRKLPFFAQHRNYLHIVILAKTAPVFTKWQGWIESKLRHLVRQLEQIPSVHIRPWPEAVPFEDGLWSHAKAMFMGITIDKRHVYGQQGLSVDFRPQVTAFVESINAWHAAEQHSGLFEMRITKCARRDLPDYVPLDGARPRKRAAVSAPPAAGPGPSPGASPGSPLLQDASSEALIQAVVGGDVPAGEPSAKRQRVDASVGGSAATPVPMSVPTSLAPAGEQKAGATVGGVCRLPAATARDYGAASASAGGGSCSASGSAVVAGPLESPPTASPAAASQATPAPPLAQLAAAAAAPPVRKKSGKIVVKLAQ